MDFMLATLPFQDDVDSSYATNPMLSRAKILIIAESISFQNTCNLASQNIFRFYQGYRETLSCQ